MNKTCSREAPFNAGEAEVVEARSSYRLEHNVLENLRVEQQLSNNDNKKGSHLTDD